MVGILVLLSIILLFIIIGTYLMQGKGAFLIAGYNTMPPEEKDQYDVIALCRFMGKMMYAFSLCLVLFLLGDLYRVDWPFYMGTVLMVGLTVFMLIYMNTGQRFKKMASENRADEKQ